MVEAQHPPRICCFSKQLYIRFNLYSGAHPPLSALHMAPTKGRLNKEPWQTASAN